MEQELIVFTAVYIVTLILFTVKYIKSRKILNAFKKESKSTEVLREILEVSFEKESIDKSTKKIIKALVSNYKFDFCSVYRFEDNTLHLCASNLTSSEQNIQLTKHVNSLLSDKKSAYGRILASSNSCLDYPSASERFIKYSYFIPLRLKDESLIGAILLESTDYSSNRTEKELELIKVIVDTISITMQNLIYYDEIVSMATRDGLTKMYNRRYMDTTLAEKVESKRQFSVAMMDIDHFKKFNDTYGHLFGDIVLIEVSKYIRDHVKEYGEVYRYGGEEFLIQFNDMDCEEAYKRLDVIREGISNLIIEDDDGVSAKVTASFGISEYPKDTVKSAGMLRELADKALYYSKEHGRNKVSIYSEVKDKLN